MRRVVVWQRVRRPQLGAGTPAAVTAAWVQFLSLEVKRLRRRHRRMNTSTYLYEAVDLDFRAQLECDAAGIVGTYGALWKRCP
jgi:hypothetical protein